jgi:DNA-directed RNA polymerase subunit M/transcription elongation factor TFIIS
MSQALGRLKHSLRGKCPDCKGTLQLRVRDIRAVDEGIEITKPEEYIACSKCDYEQDVEQKRKRRKDYVSEV